MAALALGHTGSILAAQVPVASGGIRRMRRARSMRTAIAAFLVLGGLAALAFFAPGPIEGFWGSRTLKCMCGCHVFWRFRNGEVIEYRSAHLPPQFVATYRKVGWNTYRMSLFGDSKPECAFTLHGGLLFLRFGPSPADPDASRWGVLSSFMYRVMDRRKNEDTLRRAAEYERVRPP